MLTGQKFIVGKHSSKNTKFGGKIQEHN